MADSIVDEMAQAIRHPGCGCDGAYVCASCCTQARAAAAVVARRLREAVQTMPEGPGDAKRERRLYALLAELEGG